MKTAPLILVGLSALTLACLVARSDTRPRMPRPIAPGKAVRAAKLNTVDFDREIRPILSENCFACHGFDAGRRQAGLRLDTPDGAYKKLPTGGFALVPGNLKASEAAERIVGSPGLRMPPVGSTKKLTTVQIATLRAWIAQGAHYTTHWAFVAPKRPPLPTVQSKTWVKNPIDRFILARLEQEGLKPSPEADKATILRRVTFDLNGLPPTPAELSAFLSDKSPHAYEAAVDRLLASPHYGERMANAWLDLARYADTHGYHIDSQRDMWRWREWVIDAFNHNLPYDQFTIHQLAGDMLPNASLDQKIASGFNRNHPIDFEGGAIPEEYAAAYIFDRIDTTSTVFMGLTMRCAQCHDHKYDPISQKDFYRFYAFFNNISEQGLDGQKGNAVPFLKAPSSQQQAELDAANKKISELEQTLKARASEAQPALAAWLKSASQDATKVADVSNGLMARYALDETSGDQAHDATGKQPAGIVKGPATWAAGKLAGGLKFDGGTYINAGTNVAFDRGDKFSYGAWVYPTSPDSLTVLSRMDDGSNFQGWDMYLQGGKVFVHMIHQWETNAMRVNTKTSVELNKWHHLFAIYDGSSKARGIKIYVDGKPAELDVTHDSLTDSIKTLKPMRIGSRTPGAPFKGMLDEVRIYNRELSGEEVAQLAGADAFRALLATPVEKRTPEQSQTLARYYLETQDPAYKKLNTDLVEARRKQTEIDSAVPTTMVMQEMDKPRDTFLLIRGQYDQKGEKVTAGVPAFLPAPGEQAPTNRLGLARWLVSPSNPLTARVAVNRFWQMAFGQGIVKTAENFGTQGDRPSHPELLDWLATEFMRTGWDMKAMQKLIVTSATYRQDSRRTPLLAARDPENVLLARGARFRLPAEMVRDQALAVSGLLVDKLGGPSVKPYQPAGLWEEIAFGGGFSAQTYQQDHGESLYRRSMYTFWKRTCPPPALQTFDAPEREFCMVRRSVTNTPMQALVLMNDPTYVEASRKFAERILTEGGATPTARLTYAFRIATERAPHPAELKILLSVLNDQLATFRKNTAGAAKLLSVGESAHNDKLDAAELAAWTDVANVILNLDETITRS